MTERSPYLFAFFLAIPYHKSCFNHLYVLRKKRSKTYSDHQERQGCPSPHGRRPFSHDEEWQERPFEAQIHIARLSFEEIEELLEKTS